MLRLFKNTLHLVNAILANLYYRIPGRHLTVIAITGTDGKTTTSHLIYEILKVAGKKVSLISTIEAIINGESIDTGFHVTTPSPWLLQKLLRRSVEKGSKYLVLEVTSHALDQFRVLGCPIDIAVITNISHEHLDYHKTLINYRNAKAKIIRSSKYCVLNKDEANYSYLRKKCKGSVVTFAIDTNADYTYKDFMFRPVILGKYNLYNCLSAATVASILKIDKLTINKAISQFKGIPGRMQEIKTDRNFRVFIDFAHKPNALENVLSTCRTFTKNNIIVIFGCAGLRDRSKRQIMGEIAGKLADRIILTGEDPRTEDVRDIIASIANGCKEAKCTESGKTEEDLRQIKTHKRYYFRIPDRQEAINFAIRKLAGKGDIIISCGKGHEKSMCYGKTEYPWDEKKAIEKALYGSIKTVVKV